MKTIDVLIIYELKSRELENCALIAAELESRGYTTRIVYNYSIPIRYHLKPKVVIVPHAYNEAHMAFYLHNKFESNRNVVSMQYEQILSESSEDGVHNPSGQARMAQHTAWGEAQVKRYLKHGIEASHIHDTGSVSMDLFRPEFRGYFKSREEIGGEFGLDTSKEWILFISSFSYAKRTNEALKELAKLAPNSFNFAKLSDQSYQEILVWLEKAAKEHQDKIFIYRKHPAEVDDPKLHELEHIYPNFRCIDTYSMRQWSLVVNKLYNWYSTSLADVYFAKKSCYILRPVPIPRDTEVSVMVNATFVTSCDEFLKTITNKDYYFPIQSEDISFFYSNTSKGKMAYQKVADLCEQMMKDCNMGYDYRFAYPHGLKFYVKYIYDTILYEYGKRYRTNQTLIKMLNRIPFLKKVASKLALYNNDLYQAEELANEYKQKFEKIINEIES